MKRYIDSNPFGVHCCSVRLAQLPKERALVSPHSPEAISTSSCPAGAHQSRGAASGGFPQCQRNISVSAWRSSVGHLGHCIWIWAHYILRVLPFVLSLQRHSHKDSERFPLDSGLPTGLQHQWELYYCEQQHWRVLRVLPALWPDEKVQLWGGGKKWHR